MESIGHNIKLDLTGQHFGKLTALYPTDKKSSNKSIMWHCRCECGNEIDVPANNLKNNNTNSCGCLKKSLGEKYIKQILIKNNCNFIYDKCYFKDLINKNNGR